MGSSESNVFFKALNGTNAGEIRLLAIAFKGAHEPSDVLAACRALRTFTGVDACRYMGGSLLPNCDDYGHPLESDLPALRDMAHEYYDSL